MSFSSEYAALRKKRKKNEEEEVSSGIVRLPYKGGAMVEKLPNHKGEREVVPLSNSKEKENKPSSQKSSFAEQYAELRSKRSSSAEDKKDDDIAPVRKYGTRLWEREGGGIGSTIFINDVAPATENRSTLSSTIANRKLDEQQAITKSLFKTRLEEREANKKNSIIREGSNNGPSYANYKKLQEDRENKTGRFADEEDEERTWFQANAFKDVDSVGDALVAVGKTVGGTLGDIGVNVVEGAASMVEGIIDFGAFMVAKDIENHLSTHPRIIRGKEKEQLEAREKLQSVAGDIRDFAMADITGDTLAPAKEWLDKGSLLGDKSDSISQGLGQIATIYFTGGLGSVAGLGSAGASALTTGSMFASSAGQGISEAYAAGASDNQAMAYGALKGIADAGSELIFGGLGKGVNALGVSRGLSSLDDMFAKKLSDGISNQVVKNFVEFGVKSSAEGLEEVLAGLGTAAAQKLTYMSDEELSKLIDDQDLFEQFIVGTVASGLSQSGYIPGMQNGSLRESNKTGRDFITGYTQSEQSVIDRELADRIAELEKDGEELSEKDKKKLLEEVQSDVERGFIDTDKIEEILGGDRYTAWKDADAKESKLIEEYEMLADTPFEKLSLNEQKRRDELDAQIENLRSKPESRRLRGELSSSLSDQLKNSRLNESYNERVRRREKFVDDVSKYENEAAKKSIQNLIDIGYANNSNAVHDFAENVAKMAEASGQVFSFVTDEKLREMGKAKEGRRVNGFIDENGITVNLDSRAWEFVVGHEVTHAFDKAKSYGNLHEAIKAYAEQKGEWNTRLAEMKELYEGQNADAEAELVSDLVGEYLFGDADFINNLSTKNQNVFQKMYAEIKHLLKMVTAGSKQARQLERAKHAFEKAMREGGTASVEGTKHSLSGDSDGQKLTKGQQEYFKDSQARDENGALKLVYHASPTAGYTVFDGGKGEGNYRFGNHGKSVTFFTDSKEMSDSYAPSAETMNVKRLNKMGDARVSGQYEGYLNIKNPYIVDAEGRYWSEVEQEFSPERFAEISSTFTSAEKSALIDLASWENLSGFREEINEAVKNTSSEASRRLARAYNKFPDMEALYDMASDGFSDESIRRNAMTKYTTNDIVERALRDGSYDGVIIKNVVDYGGHAQSESRTPATDYIVFDSNQFKARDNKNPTENEDIRYSLSVDSEGRQLSEGQKEYFKDSKIRDHKGDLLVCYHASDSAFTVFDKEKIGSGNGGALFGKGFYFTPDLYLARDYGENLGEYYLNIKNPFEYYSTNENYVKDMFKKSGYEYDEDFVNSLTEEDLWDADFIDNILSQAIPNKNAYAVFSDMVQKAGFDGIYTGDEIVVFDSNQIKRTDNKNPTENPDTRYSLTSELDGQPIENERLIRDEYDTQYSLSHSKDIADGQKSYLANQKMRFVSDAELEEAQRVTSAMVDVMMKYSSILPEDKIGKVLTKNGSYDRSVENTTICVRTLAYNEFVDKVQKEIGRPLTQMESFLVSQKLYDIATEPQCLYCYVSLDRKSYNEMLLRYMQDRDTVLAKYNNSDKSASAVDALYQEFLNGRKDTKNMKTRFNKWISYADNGTQLLSLADIATNERQSTINADGGILAEQLKDARAYAQSASWSKIQKDYVAYRDEILKLGDRVVKNLNEHYGMRWYSFSDYSAAFIVENMQQITDASIRGLKGLSYTKDTDYAEIFAPSGMNINVSVFVKQKANGEFYIDERQSANLEKALRLREQYPNVGIVATVTDDAALRWAGEQEWTDVIIPFHIVRTGTDVAEYYKWLNYTSESGDTIKDKSLWEAYLDSLNVSESGRKKVSKNIYPSEHKNDKATYLQLCESRGLSPRFVRYAGEPWYMKLVNETRLSADNTPALKPIFNEDAAKASFEKFVDKGGYEGGWYKEGVDVDAEAKSVADDVLAGRKADEVEYGRQDVDPEALMSGRRANRTHGQHSLSRIGEDVVDQNAHMRLNPLEDVLPVRKDANVQESAKDARTATDEDVMPMPEAEQRIDLKYLMEEDEALPVREDVQAEAETAVPTPETAEATSITTVGERLSAKKGNYETELESNKANRAQAWANYDAAIAEAQAEYDGLKNKNTKRANNLLRRIDRYKRQQANVDADYAKRISDIESRIGRTSEKIELNEQRKAQLASDIASLNMPTQERESSGKVAKSLTEESGKRRKQRKQRGILSLVKEYVLDNGMVFEDESKKHHNRQLEADWNMIRNAKSMAQRFLNRSTDGAKSIVELEAEVRKKGLTQDLYDYLHHKHNVDRMSIESKAQAKIADIIANNPILGTLLSRNQSTGDILNDPLFKQNAETLKADVDKIVKLKEAKNHPVFGDTITAEISAAEVAKLEKAHPELKNYAEEIYANNRHLRDMLVEEGIITPETAELWEEMYPHFVPIRRAKKSGGSGEYGRRQGVNAPLKRAEGGNTDIEPIFNTIALRAEQTYKAVLKNRFGVELMNTIQTPRVDADNNLGGKIDTPEGIENTDSLLMPGDGDNAPTFTVFENGEKVTFEITEEMYDAMRPTGAVLSYTSKGANAISNLMRGVLTEYSLPFIASNFSKDIQDVLMNSQHPAQTYAAVPRAIAHIISNGSYLNEYYDNGGESLSFFNNETMEFVKKNVPKEVFMTLTGLNAISKANKVIELVPRLAEYIASREAGQSIEVSMLDAARVTTNFAAGGKLTKMLNRNGATFLNASVQGLAQNIRNIREAKMNGLKGWIGLAAKTIIAGAPALILNNLVWDDDDEYEELSDYIKQNYYVVAKFGDGKFVRVPKGRIVAVIQDAFTQIANAATGDDEIDFESFAQLVINNLVPNNPYEDNVASPIAKMLMNETWYGGDLVPTRLQDVPEAEQYDETTDAISKWLGEKLNFSPYKINYLIDQYTGGIGDILLPMITPESETGNDSAMDYVTAPFRDKFTTDSVLKNQNTSDFYDLKDELNVNANSSKATDDDTLKNKYMNAMSDRISELQKQKREIQSSNLSKSEKYELTRDLQKEIVVLTKEAIDSYENLNEVDDTHTEIGGYYFEWYTPEEGEPYWRKMTDSQKTKYLLTKDATGHYVTDGSVHYRLEEDGSWTKISDKDLARQNEVTKELGITPDEYWSKTETSFFPVKNGEYEYAYENPGNYEVAKAVGGYDAYKSYSKELSGIKADKDENGKSISGSRKEKVLDYINGLDIDYGEKIILFKNEYNADDTYNDDIVDYLNSRDDISYSEMKTILEELGAKVDSRGNITW